MQVQQAQGTIYFPSHSRSIKTPTCQLSQWETAVRMHL